MRRFFLLFFGAAIIWGAAWRRYIVPSSSRKQTTSSTHITNEQPPACLAPPRRRPRSFLQVVTPQPRRSSFYACTASTASLSCLITAGGSAAPKMALPATMQFAPAFAAASIVFGPSPPSTWMSRSGQRFLSVSTC